MTGGVVLLFLKQTRDYKYVLMTTGGGALYGVSGNLENENVEFTPDIMSGAQKVSGISVLSYDGGHGEIAVESNTGMKKFKSTMNLTNLVTSLMTCNQRFICQLKSKGNLGTRYRQNIFIYPEDFDCYSLIKALTGNALEEVN